MELRKPPRVAHKMRVTQFIKRMLTGLIILSLVFAVNHLRLSHYFPIRNVNIYGVHHIQPQAVQQLILPLLQTDFFRTDVDQIRDRLQQLAWVAKVVVQRRWPDRIDIAVIEKEPVAIWNQQDLLSSHGEVFHAEGEKIAISLPHFSGPSGQQMLMLSYYEQMNRLLAPLHAKILKLELTNFVTWKLWLDNGMAIQVGHRDTLTRLTHFVKVFPKVIGDRATDVDYIDLRYPNGMAVRWKKAAKG